MKSKKLLSIILCTALLAAAFAGCGNSSSDTGSSSDAGSNPTSETVSSSGNEASSSTGEPEPLTLPISTDGAELQVWTVYEDTLYKDPNEIKGVQKAEELTGVHINWIPVSQSVITDQFGIMLASGEYPDIVFPPVGGYPGGYEKGIEDGIIYPEIASLIDQYMPNYKGYLNTNDEVRREATTDSGIQMLRVIVGPDGEAKSEGTVMSLAYRKDMLEKLGMQEPTTVDEWHEVLTAAKEQLGVEYPMMLNTNGGSDFSLAWGVSTNSQYFLQMDGDTVTSGLLDEGFGQYLDTMRQWYSEGLIDPNFTGFNYYLDTPSSVENNAQFLYSMVVSAFTGQGYLANRMVTNEDAYLQPVVNPVLNEGDEPVLCSERITAKDMFFISTSCEDPVVAAKWIDFLYSEEGERLNWYGVEGESYELDENGEPQFTDTILAPESGIPQDVLKGYALSQNGCWIGKHNVTSGQKLTTAMAGGVNQGLIAEELWSAPEVNLTVPIRSLTLTEDEGDDANRILTSITTMVEEYMVNYIIGADQTSYEDFKNTLLEFQYQDAIDIYQAAYDRFLER